jgi:fibro-slime domain-containing protein
MRIGLGVTVCAASATAALADEPEVIYLRGTVRDFMKSHPDFNISTSTGHVAQNITLTSSMNRPVFTGAGFRVGTQWRDRFDRNIPPHLFYFGGVAQFGSQPDYNPDNVTFDSWNSAEGTYSETSNPDAPPMNYPAPMPDVFPPTGLPAATEFGKNSVNQSLYLSSPGSTYEVSKSFQCKDLTTDRDITINISPNSDIIIYTSGVFNLGRESSINVPESSTLHIYAGGGVEVGQNSTLNMLEPLKPDRCVMTNLGTGGMFFNQSGKVCARLISPYGMVHLKQSDEFFGTMVAKELKIDQSGAVHWDIVELCDENLNDQAGAANSSSTGAITSANTFSQWFTDKPGVNISHVHTIALVRNEDGVYEYFDDAFFPIDGQLLGNEGDAHNFNFTYAFSASFEHEECSDRFFEFSGADDVWVYIDGKLAMDLGGVRALTPQVVEIDRLGLVDGQTYKLHFFYAQRNPHESVFNIRTDLPLESSPSPVVTLQFD